MGGCTSMEASTLRCQEREKETEASDDVVLTVASDLALQVCKPGHMRAASTGECSSLSSTSSATSSSGDLLQFRDIKQQQQLRPRSALSSPIHTLKVFETFPVAWNSSDFLSPWSRAMEGCEAILFEVSSFLLEEPEDFRRVMLNKVCAFQLQPFLEILWQGMYQRRWPSFYDCLTHHQAKAWCALYGQTLRGQRDFPLEVFEREKKIGFSMSVMPARVSYNQQEGAYIASYVSASEVRPETIPISEEHRLRFCPCSAAQRLDLEPFWSDSASSPEQSPQVPRVPRNRYPYQVLEGLQGLEVGQPVELQWKMQLASPFGWWHCHLETLHPDEEGSSAWATVIFKHFSPRSRWYRLRVHVGQRAVKRCDFGGFTGGLRPVSKDEERRWMRFFPEKILDV